MTKGRRCVATIDGQERVWFWGQFSRALDDEAVQPCIAYARQEVRDDGYRITDDEPAVLLNELQVGHLVRFGFTEEPGDYEGRPLS